MNIFKILVNKKNSIYLFLSGILLGILFFIYIYGFEVINPTYVEWIYTNKGDLFQHQLGFEFFRNDSWDFPLGMINNYGYPYSTSIVYMDSIPLLAIIFKIFRDFLPEKFQYLGIWGVFCFAMQGGISTLILRKYIPSNIVSIVGSSLFICSSIILQRMFNHTALASHWLILMGILICIYKDRLKSIKHLTIIWSVLLGIAVAIHPYFIPMLGILMLSFLIEDLICYRKAKRFIYVFLGGILSTLIVFFVIGGFLPGPASGEGLGNYSLNLNTFINSQGYSYIFKGLPLAFEGQYEGFQYLGMGVIMIIPIAIYINLNNIKEIKKIDVKKFIPVILMVILFIIVASGGKLTYNSHILIEFPLESIWGKILSPFRSTGRLSWPLFYIIIAYLIIIINRKNKKIGIISTCIVVMLQLIDLGGMINPLQEQFQNKITYESSLKSDFWSDIRKEIKHIEFLSDDMSNYHDIALYAAENNITLNNGYIARKDQEKVLDRIEKIINDIRYEQIDSQTLYILPNNISSIGVFSNNMQYFIVDGYEIIMHDKIDLSKYKDIKINTKNYISINPLKLQQENCLFDNNTVTIFPGGRCYGPYITLYPGSYEIEIIGEKLSHADFDVVYNFGGSTLKLNQVIEQSNSLIKYSIDIDEKIENLEFRVINNTNDLDIKLAEIRIYN